VAASAPLGGFARRSFAAGRRGIALGRVALLAPAQLDPFKQHEARFLNLLRPWPCWWSRNVWSGSRRGFLTRKNYLVNMSAVLLLAQSLWQLAATEQWRGFTGVLHNLMLTQKGIVRLMDTPYGRQPAVGGQRHALFG